MTSWKGIGRELFVGEDEGGGEHFGSTLLLVDEVGKEVTVGVALDDQSSSTRVAKSLCNRSLFFLKENRRGALL
jgi:hypothetical protein